ncbi:MAG: type II/IV secretion system ATPase subunit [Candidatus Nezhaarchaeota archaeon]|nr:type II/IV secretion system ATPase subunit [Candidatus Nezhaarchaeota archaeon]
MSKAELPGKRYRQLYLVNPPYAYVGVVADPLTGELRYEVIEPVLSEEEVRVMEEVKEVLRYEADSEADRLSGKIDADYLRRRVEKIVKRYKLPVRDESFGKIMYYLVRDLLGYGKLDPIMRDPNVEDVSCDGVKVPVYVFHTRFESMRTNVVFESPEELDSFIRRLAYKASQQITVARPIVEGSLPEGFRVHLTLGEVSRRGSTFTIRKYRAEPFTIIDLIDYGTLSPEVAAYLWLIVENARSAMMAGPTASGKTTMLNAVTTFIRPEAKVVTIEETPELRLLHENWIPMITRPSLQPGVQEVSLFDLLKSALRQRPDYIIVGEIRGEEAYTFFQALAVGHGGLCTIHAENIDAAVKRLETKPMDVPRALIPLINSISFLRRVRVGDKVVRRVVEVVEVVGLDPTTNEVMISPAYRWYPAKDSFTFTGRSYVLEKIAKSLQVSVEEVQEELKRREVVLRWMYRRKYRDFQKVSEVVRAYHKSPSSVYRMAEVNAPW